MKTAMFMTEWALAVHKAFWFPLLFWTGLEARGIDTGWLSAAEQPDPVEAWPVARRKAA